MPIDLVVKARFILPMTGSADLRGESALAIDRGRVVALDSVAAIEREYAAQRVIDAGNSVVLPGFVDVHTHLPQAFLRGIYHGVDKGSCFLPFLMTDLMTPYRARVFGRIGCLEALRFGTTTVQSSMNHMLGLAEAVRETGIRAVLAEEVCDMDYAEAAGGRYSVVKGQGRRHLDRAIELLMQWQGKADGRITIGIAPLAPDLVIPETFVQVVQAAQRFDAPLLTHLAQSRDEVGYVRRTFNRTPVAQLADLGGLGRRTIAAHCVYASDEDLELLRRANAAIAHCPRGYLANGITAPLASWLRAGLRVGLGTDDVHHKMWETLRAARYAAAVHSGDGEIGVSDYQLLELATVGGAEVLHMSDEIGSIGVGKRADLQIVDLDHPALSPTADLINSLVLYGGDSVKMVLVDGKIVHGDPETATRVAAAIEEADQEHERIWYESKAVR